MLNLLTRFLRDESGEDLIEYGLLTAFVAGLATVVLIADPMGLGTAIKGAFQKAITALNSDMTP